MKFENRPFAAPATFEEFVERHDLTVVVHERGRSLMRGGLPRFYASAGVEISDGGFLTSVHGDGATREEAIANLASRLAGERLVRSRSPRERFNAPVQWALPPEGHRVEPTAR